MTKNIILCGFKNCGKTTVGKLLAKDYACRFIDTDKHIIMLYHQKNNCQLTIREIYQREGASAFRQLEQQAILSLTGVTGTVIATGGGSILIPENIAMLKTSGIFIYLFTASSILKKRMRENGAPAYLDPEYPETAFDAIYAQREKIYRDIADRIIDTTALAPDKIVRQIISLLHRKTDGK